MWVVGRDFLLDGDHNDLLGKFEVIGHFNVDILVQWYSAWLKLEIGVYSGAVEAGIRSLPVEEDVSWMQ